MFATIFLLSNKDMNGLSAKKMKRYEGYGLFLNITLTTKFLKENLYIFGYYQGCELFIYLVKKQKLLNLGKDLHFHFLKRIINLKLFQEK